MPRIAATGASSALARLYRTSSLNAPRSIPRRASALPPEGLDVDYRLLDEIEFSPAPAAPQN
jgi:hypothetical protein